MLSSSSTKKTEQNYVLFVVIFLCELEIWTFLKESYNSVELQCAFQLIPGV